MKDPDPNAPDAALAAPPPQSAARASTRRGTLGERYARWWLDDYPPLDGRLRFVFYFGLLYLTTCHDKSFFRIKAYENTDPELFNARGLMGLLGVPYVDPGSVRVVMAATRVAWVLAGIGLFTRFSSIATAAGTVFLHGLFFDANAGNRTWFLPAYSLVALCFATNGDDDDAWSADHHLLKFLGRRRRRPTKPPRSHRSISETGFARKCILVTVVGFYVASGMGKLYASGLRWADGHSLQYYASSVVYYGRAKIFTWMLTDHLWFAALSSAGALLLELGSFLMLVSSGRLRLVFLVALSLMHAGIRLTMGPWYFSNVWCYVLLVDWNGAARWVRANWIGFRLTVALARRRPAGELLEEASALNSEPDPSPPPLEIGSAGGVTITSARVATASGTCLLVLMTVVAFLHIEWWPLTNVDLYSGYFKGDDIRSSYPRSCYSDAKCAQRMVRALKATNYNHEAQMRLASNVKLRLVKKKGKKRLTLEGGVGVPTRKQWKKSYTVPVVLEDFVWKPEGDISWDAKNPHNPASLFLRRILPSIRRNARKWKDYDYAVLTFDAEDSDVTIAKVPLALGDDPKRSPSGPGKTKNGNRTAWSSTNNIVAQVFLFSAGLSLYLTRVRIRAYAKKHFLTSNDLPIHEIVPIKL